MKKCNHCKKNLTYDKFSKTNLTKVSSRCKKCQSKYSKEHYRNNKEKYNLKSNKRNEKFNDLIVSTKNIPCMDCGKSYPSYVMDFDHRDPSKKLFHVARGRALGKSLLQVKEEINKCDIVCSNCHRERTYGVVNR